MPTYDYECSACGEVSEFFQTISEAHKTTCPQCGKKKLKRLIGGGAGFIFKGSGFYITDYRSDDYKAKAKADSESSSKKSDSGSSSSSDSSKKSSGSGDSSSGASSSSSSKDSGAKKSAESS